MCSCYTLAVWLGTILNVRNVVPNLERSNTFTGYGTIHPPLPFLSWKAALNNYLIVQEALQGATNYWSNSTVELSKTYILSNSTAGLINFTISIDIGKPTVQSEP